jgi:hypothetical protein
VASVACSVCACRTNVSERPSTHRASFSPDAVASVGPTASPTLTDLLPDRLPPFTATGAIQSQAGFVRRTYGQGHARVEVTLAHLGPEQVRYDTWLAGSADYPQANLPVPASDANGFFTCASDRQDAACDLHIQLRAGYHVELMGNGRVPRQDLAEMVRHIPLATLAKPGIAIP